MAYSSILGAEQAPSIPSGRDAEALGPSDNSDSGSDAIGTSEARADSDAVGTGERGSVAGSDAREGGDILPDHVVMAGSEEDAGAVDTTEMTDLDAEGDEDVEADAAATGEKR